jgi:hypothetical protein
MFDAVFSFYYILTMLRCGSVIVLFSIFAIEVLTIETRSIPEDNIIAILNDPLSDDHRKLLHAFTGYRHRFEQSPNFKALRWSLGNLKDSGLCDLCDLGAPVVSKFLDFQS